MAGKGGTGIAFPLTLITIGIVLLLKELGSSTGTSCATGRSS